ncbi:MAG TPA: beta-ketoacyl synthase N-terminal-like domain-containing protein [Vicinamibacteria bacterium]
MSGKRQPLGGAEAPIVITGCGVVTAAGRGMEPLITSLRNGHSHLAPIRRVNVSDLPLQRGGEVTSTIGEGKARFVQCVRLALEDAIARADEATHPVPLARTGLALGTTLGLVDELARDPAERISMTEAGRRLAVDSSITCLKAGSTGGVPLGGPRSLFSLACASGLCATEQAAADLAMGRAEAMLVGGADTLGRFMQGGFCALGALAFPIPGDDRHHSREGLVLGEAACSVVLEPFSKARERGHPGRAVLRSQRLVSDGYHLASPDPSGGGMARAISLAIADAELTPSGIGAVLLTALASPLHENMLRHALETTLGSRAREIPMTSHELAIGHVLAASSVLVLAHAVTVLEERRVYPAFPVEALGTDRSASTFTASWPLSQPNVLTLSVGFGGFNGAAVVGNA